MRRWTGGISVDLLSEEEAGSTTTTPVSVIVYRLPGLSLFKNASAIRRHSLLGLKPTTVNDLQ